MSHLYFMFTAFILVTNAILFSSDLQRSDDDDDDSSSDAVCDFNEEVDPTCLMVPFSKHTMQLGKRPKFLGKLTCDTQQLLFDPTDGSFISITPGAINVTTCYESSIGGYQTIASFAGFIVSVTDEYGVENKCATCWEESDPDLGNAELYFQTQTQIANVQTPVGIVQSTGKVRVVQNTIPTTDPLGTQIREVVVRTTVSPTTGHLERVVLLDCQSDSSFC